MADVYASRVRRLLDKLQEQGAQQMLITDENSIYYLTIPAPGCWRCCFAATARTGCS